jgi:hypothetical protein
MSHSDTILSAIRFDANGLVPAIAQEIGRRIEVK